MKQGHHQYKYDHLVLFWHLQSGRSGEGAPDARANYIMDTARPVAEIKTTYPYDIELKQADGTLVRSDQVFPMNGKPTILLFWLTTCYPCRMELETLKENVPIWSKETDFNLIAISTDFEKNFGSFTQRVKDGQWPWSAYNDLHREFSRFLPGGLNGLPQTFVLNGSGEIVYHKRKFRPGDEVALYEAIKSAGVDQK
ncbi:MAG: TlpA family protein disulfide reductase [Saprospiraceae bacterium]|nr:TlpA family protein disulfide reductase [Saprospiraceae bacterium]